MARQKKRSCLTKLLQFFEDATNYIDQGLPVDDIIYLNFAKAYDHRPYKRLISKQKGGRYNEFSIWISE